MPIITKMNNFQITFATEAGEITEMDFLPLFPPVSVSLVLSLSLCRCAATIAKVLQLYNKLQNMDNGLFDCA